MILPFTTNQWNAVRFVVLNLLCVPVLEFALHKTHQLRTGHRILNGKHARIRRSRFGNWCLHQEVDDLNNRSKITLIAVMILYVGLTLYTEYASGTTPALDTWVAPASKEKSIQGKPVLYDTIMAPGGAYTGCKSKASRLEMQRLPEDLVFRKVRNYASVRDILLGLRKKRLFIAVHDTSISRRVAYFDNGSHVLFAATPQGRRHWSYGTLDNEGVCLETSLTQLACFSISEKINVIMLFGNLIHFPDGLLKLPVVNGTKLLLSNDAFEISSDDVEDNPVWAKIANSRTRDEFLKNRNEAMNIVFDMKFKYAEIAGGQICQDKPEIEPPILRISQNPNIHVYGWQGLVKSIRMKKTRTCIGLFDKKLLVFWETRNSTMVCYETFHDRFCAAKTENGSTILSRAPSIAGEHTVLWALSWKKQVMELTDLARGALVSHQISEELFGSHPLGADAKSMARQLHQGIPKLTQVGIPGATYSIRVGERATMVAWVLVLWVLASLFGICFLLLSNLMKPRLLPDVEFLYRHVAMQTRSTSNCTDRIRNAPTVSASTTGEVARLHIFYGDRDVENLSIATT